MTFDEYFKVYPEAESFHDYLVFNAPRSGVFAEGMLQFDVETAPSLGGPFPGGFAGYSLTDMRKVKNPRHTKKGYKGMCSVAANGSFHTREYPTEDWTQPGMLATMQLSIQLHVFGNDDSSWAMFFPSRTTAKAFLKALEAKQPLNMDRDIWDGGFIFWN